ncbi:MAG TPA: hypothetical protein PKE15_00185 [Ottowia sp.]|nr:hypothetical protein [Ottowia sp.]
MNLQPHQLRVLDEYEQLNQRRLRLGEFIGSKAFNQIDEAERALLGAQLTHMDAYFVTLKQRIDLWKSAPPAPIPPVDRTQQQLTDGSPVTSDHRDIDPASGQQKGYVVLSAEERAKGFVRPVRRSYVHVGCGAVTTMAQALAETYARDPSFYGGTFCCSCRTHYPVAEFRWDGTDEVVGS